jgi:hypothetical protein
MVWFDSHNRVVSKVAGLGVRMVPPRLRWWKAIRGQ